MSAHVIIQARMGSTRLPGKVAEPIGGRSALEHVVLRALMARGVGRVTVAHPDLPQSLQLSVEALSATHVVCFLYPDAPNVLGRIWEASQRWPGQCIVRLTADCPFVPVSAIEAVIAAVRDGADYAETRSDPSSRPNGIDAQAFTSAVLGAAQAFADNPSDREHVTPALRRWTVRPTTVDMLEGVRLDDLPPWRMTLDTEEDLAWFRAVAAYTDTMPPSPTLREFVQLMHDHPELERMDVL